MKPSVVTVSILVLLATLLSSCGLIVINTPGNAPDEVDTTAVETESSAEKEYEEIIRDYRAEAKARLDSIETVDYSGAVMKIASTSPALSDADDAPQVLSKAVKDRNTLVEEKYGITIITVSVSDAELFSELSASKKSGMYYADLVTVPQDSLVSYIASGLIFNLRSMPKTDLGADYFNSSAIEAASAGYGSYAVAGEATCSPYTLPAVYFSIDRLNELGISLPYDKAKSGAWTWDLFNSYLTQVDAEAYTPFCTGDSGDYAVDCAYYSVGGTFMSAGAMRYPTVDLTVEESAPLIEIISDAFTRDTSLIGDVSSSETFTDSAVFMIDTLEALSAICDSETKWGILPMPKAHADGDYISLASPNSPFYAVPSVLNSDERTSLVLRAIFAASYGSMKEAFVKQSQNSFLRDNESANMLELLMENVRYDFTYTVSSMYEEAPVATSYAVRNAVFGTADLAAALHNAVWRCDASMAAAFEMK